MIMNYEEDIKIDDSMLDMEWLDQPEKMMSYCIVMADAMKALDYAKQNIDIVTAELDKEIRTDPEKFGISKITESVVSNTITLADAYKEANKKLIEAKYEVEMAKGAVRSFEQRKEALEALVKLHGQSYFAGPKVPHDLSKERSTWKKSDNPVIKRNK